MLWCCCYCYCGMTLRACCCATLMTHMTLGTRTLFHRTNPFNWSTASSDGAAFSSGDWLFLVGGYDSTYNTLSTLTAINTVTGEVNSTLPGMAVSRGDLAAIAATGECVCCVSVMVNGPCILSPAAVWSSVFFFAQSIY